MHLLPDVVDPLPDPGFAATCGDRFAVLQFLGEAGVTEHNGVITEPAQMGARHGDRDRSGGGVGLAGQVEVVAVKGKALYQVPFTFGLKAADISAANMAVMLPVTSGDALEHGLVDGEDLLIALLESHAELNGVNL